MDDASSRLPALIARIAELEAEKLSLQDRVVAAESGDELQELRALAQRYQARAEELRERAREHGVEARRAKIRQGVRALKHESSSDMDGIAKMLAAVVAAQWQRLQRFLEKGRTR